MPEEPNAPKLSAMRAKRTMSSKGSVQRSRRKRALKARSKPQPDGMFNDWFAGSAFFI